MYRDRETARKRGIKQDSENKGGGDRGRERDREREREKVSNFPGREAPPPELHASHESNVA